MTKDQKKSAAPAGRAGATRLTLYSLIAAMAAIAGFLSISLADRLGSQQVAQMQLAAEPAAAAAATEPQSGTGLERLVHVKPAKDLPEISITDAGGAAHKLSEWKGKVVLVNLWATWCAPCKREMPSLSRLQAKLGGADFTVLPVSLDRGGADKPQHYLKSSKLDNLPLYLDGANALLQTLTAPGLPLSVLLDREGREVARMAGPAEWDSAEAETLIKEIIAGKDGS
jgi:thiol-disulfide isomerase/thioredoxin